MSETYDDSYSSYDDSYVGGRSEFIVGGDEEEYMDKVYTGGYSNSNGNYGLTSTRTCFSVLLVVVVILVLMKLLSNNAPVQRPVRVMIKSPRVMGAKVDKLLRPSSLFEYDRYGSQLINWG
jgi:hypothetical protein